MPVEPQKLKMPGIVLVVIGVVLIILGGALYGDVVNKTTTMVIQNPSQMISAIQELNGELNGSHAFFGLGAVCLVIGIVLLIIFGISK